MITKKNVRKVQDPGFKVSSPKKPYGYHPFWHHLQAGEVSPEVYLWGLQEPRFFSGEGNKGGVLCHTYNILSHTRS
jgi:hypothetical protein